MVTLANTLTVRTRNPRGPGGDDTPTPGGSVQATKVARRPLYSVRLAELTREPETDRDGYPLYDRDGRPCAGWIEEVGEEIGFAYPSFDAACAIARAVARGRAAWIAGRAVRAGQSYTPTHAVVADERGHILHAVPLAPGSAAAA